MLLVRSQIACGRWELICGCGRSRGVFVKAGGGEVVKFAVDRFIESYVTVRERGGFGKELGADLLLCRLKKGVQKVKRSALERRLLLLSYWREECWGQISFPTKGSRKREETVNTGECEREEVGSQRREAGRVGGRGRRGEGVLRERW